MLYVRQDMSARTEEEIIMKLVLKGESESDIMDYLREHDILDQTSIYRVQKKSKEVRAAEAFQPRHPPTRKIRIYGIFLIIIAITVMVIFSDSSGGGSRRYHPSGYAFWILIAGIILVIWPHKGVDKF